MLILITYDVNTENSAGRKRLRHVARLCQNYGQRVQNSVFECVIDGGRLSHLQARLEAIIDPATDSLRYYNLGDRWKNRVRHVGAKPSVDIEGTLIT